MNPVNGFLHLLIEILYPQADAVEAQAFQQTQLIRVDGAGIDLDGILTALGIHQMKMASDFEPELGQLRIAEIGGRTAAPMHLIHRAPGIKISGLHADFLDQGIQVTAFLLIALGNDLIAGAVVTQGGAKRQVYIQRQWHAGHIATLHRTQIVLVGEFFMKLQSRWVRCIPRTGNIMLPYELTIP